jgi:hypothetical protein
MKKVLLATTILGMTSGFAAAEIAFTGEATAGFASIEGADYDTYTSFELSVAASGETDSGLAFGASTSFISGTTLDFDDDGSSALDANASSFGEDNDGTMGNPEVFVSGEFGKVSFSIDGFDDYHDDDFEDHDVEYTGTFGDFSVGVRTDITGGTSSLQLGYTVAGTELGANFDESTEAWDISAERAFGAVTVGLGLDNDEVTTLNLDYEANGISAGLEIDTNEDYTVSAGYEANGLSVGAEIDQDSVWEVTAGYDLGNGLAVEAGMHESESAFLGAKMSF